MSELIRRTAEARVAEHLSAARRLSRGGRRRPPLRHDLATRLHRFADRLDP